MKPAPRAVHEPSERVSNLVFTQYEVLSLGQFVLAELSGQVFRYLLGVPFGAYGTHEAYAYIPFHLRVPLGSRSEEERPAGIRVLDMVSDTLVVLALHRDEVSIHLSPPTCNGPLSSGR